jgi:hypothetical protein
MAMYILNPAQISKSADSTQFNLLISMQTDTTKEVKRLLIEIVCDRANKLGERETV